MLISDLERELSRMPNPPEEPKIALSGSLSPGAMVLLAYDKYPILRDINYAIRNNSFHSFQKLNSYGLMFGFESMNNITLSPEIRALLSNSIYEIYFVEDNDTFVVQFMS